MAKQRPRTGDARKTQQPVKIDRLPAYVHDAILTLRNQHGKTWLEIEALSAAPFGDGKPGFVDWESLPTPVLELFPDMRIPHTNLHRWHDLRVAQVQTDVLRRAAQAREIAVAFSKAVVKKDDEAVINAARDTLMGVLSEDGSTGGRQNAARGLIKLAEVMQKAKTVRINERKVNVAEQTLQMKLDEIKRRTQELLDKLGKGDGAAVPMTRDELLGKLGELYGVA